MNAQARRCRNIWPLPGGADAYLATLRSVLAEVDGRRSRKELEARLARSVLRSCSEKTVRGYVGVPFSLGLTVANQQGRAVVLTARGRRFVRNGDPQPVLTGLIQEIEGVAEILRLLGDQPFSVKEQAEQLAREGFEWGYPMALRYRIWWLRATGAIEAERRDRADRWRLTSVGRRELRKLQSG